MRMASLSPDASPLPQQPALSPKSTAVASADAFALSLVSATATTAALRAVAAPPPPSLVAAARASPTTAGASSLLPSSSSLSPCAKTAINGGSGLLSSSLTSPQPAAEAATSHQQGSPTSSYLNANLLSSATVAVDSTKRVAEQHPTSQYQHQKLSFVLSSQQSTTESSPLSSSSAAATGLFGQPSINGSNQGSSANATPPTPIASSTGAALVMGKTITSTTNSSTMPVSTTTVPIGGGVSSSITATSNNHHSAANLTVSMSGRCGPSMIHYKTLRFLITDKPTDATLNQYIDELKRRQATDVVRVCESTYSAKRLEKAGIKCHDWAFDDGTPPPPKIINDWLNLIIERFKDLPANTGGSSGDSQQNNPCIAVHCVAGLGRAPVLVAIALIEAGMKYEDAVEMIRDVRRGAINAKQLQYLSQYKPKKVLVFVSSNSKRKFCCII